jgi:pimeloyl-ACP methyl ester carboxylesterase
MLTIERGSGEPLIFIPGLQGRWEYLRPAVDALAQSAHVITFPLCDEPTSGAPCNRGDGFDAYAAHIKAILDAKHLERAAICGVSFGGLIALRFAATMPERTTALILASTPGPRFHLKRRHRLYARVPWLFGPLFAAEAPSRVRPEIRAAFPDETTRRLFMREQVRAFRDAPLSVSRMAARALLIEPYDRAADAARIACPTLVVHGDPNLDFVVDSHGTATYGHLIKDARVLMIEGTGHLGSITKPRQFASLVSGFLASARKDTRHSAA